MNQDNLKSKHVMALYFILALLIGCAMGIINPIATTHMTTCNTSSVWIGVISSAYFVFLSIGAILSVLKLKGKNVKSLMIAGLITAAVCAALFPVLNNIFLWLLLMALMGIGISFNMTGVQAILHSVSNKNNRGVVSGLYSFFFAVGFIVSSVIGPAIYEAVSWAAFLVGTACLLIDATLVYFFVKYVVTIPVALEEKIIHKIQLPLFSAFVYGFSETTLVTMYPMFLINQHYDLKKMGFFLAVFVVGSLVGILPVTLLSDRVGRKKILAGCMALSCFAVLGIVLFGGYESRLFFSFFSGFVIGPLYPLSLALSVEEVKENDLASATSFFTFSYGFGSAAGPFMTSLLIYLYGDKHIFTMCLVLFFAFLIYLTFKTFQEKFNSLYAKGELKNEKTKKRKFDQ